MSSTTPQAKQASQYEVHEGMDYVVVLAPEDTTDSATARFRDAEIARKFVRAVNAHDALIEYFNASKALFMTIGHPEATAEDERKAEERYEAATKAVRATIAKAGAA